MSSSFKKWCELRTDFSHTESNSSKVASDGDFSLSIFIINVCLNLYRLPGFAEASEIFEDIIHWHFHVACRGAIVAPK